MTAPFRNRKILVPAGTTKMKKANTSWRAIPQRTARQLTIFRFEEHSQANPASAKMPRKLIRL